MATILIAWVLGAGLGHVSRIAPLAKALERDGHRAVIAIWAPERVLLFLRSQGLSAIPAPGPTIRKENQQLQASFTSTLWTCGFDDPDKLEMEAGIWDGILDVVRPDVVIADTSPALHLACRDRIPLVLIGSGFSVPPAHLEDFPVVFPQGKAFKSSQEVLSVVEEVIARRGDRSVATLPGLWEFPASIYCVRELDLYREYREKGQHGRPTALGSGELTMPPQQPRVFAYLSNKHPMLPAIVGGLGRLNRPTGLFCRDLKPELRAYAEDFGVRVYDEPQDLAALLPKVSLVVHHGGLGMSQTALMEGRPQLVLPYQYEQRLNADPLLAASVARRVHCPAKEFPATFQDTAAETLENLSALGDAARSLAQTVRARETETAEERAVELVGNALAS
jgi:UDP:flavonoid glycosyltransferase YjiC (YdhE family)